MSGPDPEPGRDEADRPVDTTAATPEPDEPAGDESPPRGRPGSSTFTIEGRSAPALFVLGWLATIMGAGALLVSALASAAAPQAFLFTLGLVLLAAGLVALAGSQGIERRARGGEGYRGPSPILVFVASIPVSVLALVALGVPLGLVGFDLGGPSGSLLSVAVQALVYVGLVRLLVVDTGVLSWRAMGFRRFDAAALGALAEGAVLALPVILVTAILSAILVQLFQVVPTSPLPPAGEPAGIAANLLAGAVIAPLGEEAFFRAFATTAWVAALGATRGIVRGGLFFAFVHVLSIQATGVGEGAALALIGFVGRVPVGIALGWLFVRRGSIWAPIGLHAAFNGILLVIAELFADAVPPAG